MSIENIVELVTREVIKELSRLGYNIDTITPDQKNPTPQVRQSKSMELCMKDYFSPVLTESRFDSISRDINELIVPPKTVVTPGAKDMIRKRNIKLIYKS